MNENFEISKKLCNFVANKMLQAGEQKARNCIFEKPLGSHCGIRKSTGDLTAFVYRMGKRGVAGKVLPLQNRKGFERLPGYYRQEGAGIQASLHQIPLAPSLPYEIAAAVVQVVPYALIASKLFVDFAKQKNEIPGKSTCVAHFGSNTTVCAYTAYNEIEKKDLTLNNLLLQKVA